MAVEVEADGGDSGLGEPLCYGRHGIVVLAGEDAVHKDDHGAAVRRRVEPIGEANLIGNVALRAADSGVIRLEGEEGRKRQEYSGNECFHIRKY